MPASIILSDLTLAAPDGRPLLDNINLSFGRERAGLVGRNGVGKTTLLRLIGGELRPQAGTVSVSGILGVLRQSMQPRPAETVADLFGTAEALALLRRAETGQATAEELADIDWAVEARMTAALGRIGLDVEPEAALATLSGGQHTRAALGALIFAEPDFLLLDEPTNNLDRAGRRTVLDLLASWRGGAIVVSHDRELLEIMDAIVELTSLGATRYGGNWTAYREHKDVELAAAQHDLANAEKHVAEVDRNARMLAERKARKDGAGRRKSLRGDLPRIIAGGRKSRSEATGGANVRLAERRRGQALAAAETARARIEVLQPLRATLPSTGLAAGKVILQMQRVTAGYQPGRPIIRDLSFTITGPERIAVAGPNGAGKTTLLSLIAGAIDPWAGSVRVMARYAMLDQGVSVLDPSASIRDNFRRINRQADENGCRAALARFMFRADAALASASALSGGQLLRAGLACVLGGATPPPLLILDEPTNHLDIDSIGAVKAGLRAFDGALLVVSHDDTFLKAIGVTRRLQLPSDLPTFRN